VAVSVFDQNKGNETCCSTGGILPGQAVSETSPSEASGTCTRHFNVRSSGNTKTRLRASMRVEARIERLGTVCSIYLRRVRLGGKTEWWHRRVLWWRFTWKMSTNTSLAPRPKQLKLSLSQSGATF